MAESGQIATRKHSVATVNLQPHLNNVALTNLQNLRAGGLNVWGNSFPDDILPPSEVTVGGVTFSVVRSKPDNVRCLGQYVELPETTADWLHFLATSERRTEDLAHIHYRSGAVDPEWMRVSDFLPSRPHFGELVAARSTALHYPNHAQENHWGLIWALRVPIIRREAVRGIRLPDNPAVHVFAASLESVR